MNAFGERERRIGTALATAGASKIVQFGSQAAYVALLYRQLGPTRYGLWASITAILAFGSVASLGVVPATVNLLAAAAAAGDKRMESVVLGTTFRFLIAMAAVLLGPLLLFAGLGPWPQWLTCPPELEGEARAIGLVAVSSWVATYPLSLVAYAHAAYQEVHLSYRWQIASQVLSTSALAAGYLCHLPAAALLAAYQGTQLAVTAANGVWLTRFHRPYLASAHKEYDGQILRQIARSGLAFVGIDMSALFTNQFAILLLASIGGPAQAGRYDVAQKMTGLAGNVWATLVNPLWGAMSDAWARGESRWMRRAFRYTVLAAGVGGPVLFGVVFLAGPTIIRVWSGAEKTPGTGVLAFLCVLGVSQAMAIGPRVLLMATGRVAWLVILASINVVCLAVLGPLLGRAFGATGVAAAQAVANVACVAIPSILLAEGLLRRFSNGQDLRRVAGTKPD